MTEVDPPVQHRALQLWMSAGRAAPPKPPEPGPPATGQPWKATGKSAPPPAGTLATGRACVSGVGLTRGTWECTPRSRPITESDVCCLSVLDGRKPRGYVFPGPGLRGLVSPAVFSPEWEDPGDAWTERGRRPWAPTSRLVHPEGELQIQGPHATRLRLRSGRTPVCGRHDRCESVHVLIPRAWNEVT